MPTFRVHGDVRIAFIHPRVCPNCNADFPRFPNRVEDAKQSAGKEPYLSPISGEWV